MKVLLVNGSPRPQGCTFTALSEMKEQFAKLGIETEIFQIGAKPIRGCIGCRGRPRRGHRRRRGSAFRSLPDRRRSMPRTFRPWY